MHTTALRSDDFEITVAGRPATMHDVFPGFDLHDRLGIVVGGRLGAAGAGSLILAAVTGFYDGLRGAGDEFFAYADYFAFHVGADHGTLRKLDVYPGHKEVVVPASPELILQAVNDRGITRLLVPDGPARVPKLAPETRHSAQRRIRTALVYSPTGQAPDGDVVVRGSAQSDAYIDAMMAGPEPHARAAHDAQCFRRTDLDEALGLLATARG